MSFLIRNLTAAPIEINDLGLTVAIGEDLDLKSETPNSIATSDDLIAFITAGDIVVLDPSDGVTQLSTVDSLNIINSTNAAPYGVQVGGKLNQLEDVNATSPTNDYVLTYNAIGGKWEPKAAFGGTPTNTCFPFYRADGTLDTITVVSGLFPFYRTDGTFDPILMETCN